MTLRLLRILAAILCNLPAHPAYSSPSESVSAFDEMVAPHGCKWMAEAKDDLTVLRQQPWYGDAVADCVTFATRSGARDQLLGCRWLAEAKMRGDLAAVRDFPWFDEMNGGCANRADEEQFPQVAEEHIMAKLCVRLSSGAFGSAEGESEAWRKRLEDDCARISG